MSQRTFLTGFAFVLLAAQACGSNDGKKNARNEGDAGMGGEAGQAEPGAGGSSAGESALPVAGMSGAGTETGGAGGQAPVEPTGGAGGEPVVVLPDPEVLFSVKPGALGLDETGVRGEANVQNAIYSSKTGKQEAEDGTNAVKITGASLGLAETDQIVAFAILQAAPQSPQYLISIADDVNGFSPGSYTTRADASYYGDGGAEEGDIYYTDGLKSFRDLGGSEGAGDDYGYNAMLATEVSLGLSPGNGDNLAPDDLTGLSLHDANQAITELYFVVNSAALGADGTAVATTEPTERGCTVFKSSLDGSNSVAFSCANLGLLPSAADPDQVDALAVYGSTKPTTVVFSVTRNSQGAVESEVEAVRLNGAPVGATLFQTSGDGQNAVLKTPRELGLYDSINTTDSELDGLAVVDAPNGKATSSGTCNVTYDPFDAVNGGGVTNFYGVHHIGDNVLVIAGDVLNAGARLLAYDAKTCAFLTQIDLPIAFAYTSETTIVPLAGWTQAKPFENVEYLRLETSGSRMAVMRYDVTGTFVQGFPITDSDYYDTPEALVYEPINDRVYAVMNQYYYSSFGRRIHVFPRPDETVTEIDVPAYYRTHPCGYEHDLIGTDPAGNLKIGTLPYDGSDYRVCTFTPSGELLPAPYFWTIDGDVDSQEGFFASDGSHYLLHQSPFSIERGTYQAP